MTTILDAFDPDEMLGIHSGILGIDQAGHFKRREIHRFQFDFCFRWILLKNWLRRRNNLNILCLLRLKTAPIDLHGLFRRKGWRLLHRRFRAFDHTINTAHRKLILGNVFPDEITEVAEPHKQGRDDGN